MRNYEDVFKFSGFMDNVLEAETNQSIRSVSPVEMSNHSCAMNLNQNNVDQNCEY